MSQSTFEAVTKVAVQEIIEKHVSSSKFGYLLSEASMENVCDEIVGLIKLSRNLKAAGDQFIAQSGLAGTAPTNKGGSRSLRRY